MAQRKRPGTNSSMATEPHASAPCSCPAPYPELEHPEEEYEERQDPEVSQHSYHNQEEADLTDSRPATPTTPDHAHRDYHSHPDSLDGDSSSDYVNNTSDEEEDDFDERLPEEDEGVTYYIRYCPEDDSYLEGMDCNEPEYRHPDGRMEPPPDTDECQEVVEEWVEGEDDAHGDDGEVRCEVLEQDSDQQLYDGRPEPVLDHHQQQQQQQQQHYPDPHQEQIPPPVVDQEVQGVEGSEGYCPDQEEEPQVGQDRDGYAVDYYATEDNGNSVRVSPYRGHKGTDGETGEEAEEDIDQIVAEIKMSMSMGSLSSGTDQSPEELAPDPAPSEYQPETRSKPEPAPAPAPAPYPQPHRHDGRPKSLNIPPARHNPELQRNFKVSNSAEQPRKQQRSDLNGPLENNNVPEPTKKTASFPSFVDVPGPCEPEDLIDGIIFAANYLGSTQLLSERNPSKNIRMMQAQEAVSRLKRVQKAAKIKKKASPEGDIQTLTEVDLFISTQRIKVLNADTQETMMDNALRTISYIADIGNIVVLMARRRMPRTASQDCIETTPGAPEAKKQYKMICHVFESEDAQLIAQSIGQAFSVAYQEFLRANGINPEDLSQKEYSDIINTQEMYNDDLIHFSNSDNCKELQLEKQKGEILGIVIVESGWGSILPTVILANMMNGGPAARSGKLSIGDQIMSINNTSLVGLPLATCQGIIKGLKNQVQVKLNIVSCPPVTTVLIKRPDLKYQLGFSVQNGIICSLMRGGIAERGGVRVGHRIIEINGQSVVATAHEKIVQALSNSVGEIHMKTMPAAMFRLLTGQETPMYI
ncbi:amyloid beta A4 precursor protein-binding family A member 2 isoform X4 [Sinocyclocheilus anshuiensis]|uniref:amyloid beta A4 precursor protein-binding family A member 2 isoform X4 n=1 Tax=Sinocyclocheilus anshuiensis TaxID=1608454 RepID=UPI0007BA0094|nr:PREDICTED: amyloid beta A4 precursor protein-binding family A member 2 isoform X4 [Sinocyclocheilus anshuiensis]